MRLCELPSDILSLILKWVVESVCFGNSLKANISVAAINQRLRQAALPLVYKRVSVDFPATGSGGSNGATTNAVYTTNLDLVVSAGCMDLVRCVRVGVARPSYGIDELALAATVLREAKAEWPAVKSLEVAGNWITPSVFVRDNVPDAESIQRVLDALVAVVPNVCTLLTGGRSHIAPVRCLFQALAERYQRQLQSVHFTFPMDPQEDVQFTRLQRLFINRLSFSDWAIPRIDPAALVKLKITDLDPMHSWTSFGADDNSPSIEFPVLRHLQLVYNNFASDPQPAASGEASTPKLHFPQLQTIRLWCSKSRCAFLESAALPPHLEKCTLSLPVAECPDIADTAMPAARDWEVCIDGGRDEEYVIPRQIRRLLLRARQCEAAHLNLRNSSRSVNTSGILGSGLTDLTIATHISVDDMLALVGNLPQLVYISVRCHSFRSPQADLSLPKPGEHGHPVAPLSTTIKRLGIAVHHDEPWDIKRAALVKYLLLGIPSLLALSMGDANKIKLKLFTKKYGPRYPHIETVAFSANPISRLPSMLFG
ncbi:hypothetical protein H4R19_001569 [Coemansia spiralis]|nr:hypothetical protein H4R19_001569 [Coemansia spiralis]